MGGELSGSSDSLVEKTSKVRDEACFAFFTRTCTAFALNEQVKTSVCLCSFSGRSSGKDPEESFRLLVSGDFSQSVRAGTLPAHLSCFLIGETLMMTTTMMMICFVFISGKGKD